jgi:hypothetical protein
MKLSLAASNGGENMLHIVALVIDTHLAKTLQLLGFQLKKWRLGEGGCPCGQENRTKEHQKWFWLRKAWTQWG